MPVCANTSAVGAQLLRDALLAGGEQAQAALAVMALLNCDSSLPENPIAKAKSRMLDIK